MQWPPTRPGLKFKKFHFVPAAFRTSSVSMPSRWKIIDSSLISAMLMSRCVFSMTLAASATLMLDALCVPAVMMLRVERVDVVGDLGCRAGRDLQDRRQPMFLVARIDPLGAVARRKNPC